MAKKSATLHEEFPVLGRIKLNRPLVRPTAPNHSKYLNAIDTSKATVCTGPAGTGKTYMACAKAVEFLKNEKVSKIVLTRPLQECGKPMGFLPGDMYEKVVDMMMPLIEALEEFLGVNEVEAMRLDGRIVILPMEKMRGRTLKDAFVILDEAQNASFHQIKMFLTRFGSKCKMVMCGDYTQSDLPYSGKNSLLETIQRFKRDLHPDVSVVELTSVDIVRDELVRWFDRVLSDPNPGNYEARQTLEPKPAAEPKRYASCECLGCHEDIWYDERVLETNELVHCSVCGSYLEVYDENGVVSPVVIYNPESSDTENCFVGFVEKPLAD